MWKLNSTGVKSGTPLYSRVFEKSNHFIPFKVTREGANTDMSIVKVMWTTLPVSEYPRPVTRVNSLRRRKNGLVFEEYRRVGVGTKRTLRDLEVPSPIVTITRIRYSIYVVISITHFEVTLPNSIV